MFFDVIFNCTDFSGRARRKEYWIYTLWTLLVGVPLFIVDVNLDLYNRDFGFGPISGIWFLLLFLPTTAVTIRRLHDSDRSGWLFLVSLVPIAGPLIMLGFMCTPGTVGENKYGEDPLIEGDGDAGKSVQTR